MHSLIDDLSILTTIPSTELRKLETKSEYVICDCIEEAKLQESQMTEIDVGMGVLQVMIKDDNVVYRFKPSVAFNEAVIGTINNGKNPLVNTVEETLVDKILNTYKDFF